MYQQIMSFWFDEIEPVLWWKKDDAFDALLVERFSEIHTRACRCELFRRNGIQNNLDFEFKHKKIIEKFGRYPHRNKLLGRQSTKEEIEFLTKPGSSF